MIVVGDLSVYCYCYFDILLVTILGGPKYDDEASDYDYPLFRAEYICFYVVTLLGRLFACLNYYTVRYWLLLFIFILLLLIFVFVLVLYILFALVVVVMGAAVV